MVVNINIDAYCAGSHVHMTVIVNGRTIKLSPTKSELQDDTDFDSLGGREQFLYRAMRRIATEQGLTNWTQIKNYFTNRNIEL